MFRRLGAGELNGVRAQEPESCLNLRGLGAYKFKRSKA